MSDLKLRKIDLTTREVPDSSFKWKLNTYSGTESQTFYFLVETGHFFLCQIAYSTMSWSPSAQASIRIYSPDGNHKLISNNYGATDLVFSDDNQSIKTPTLSYELKSKNPILYKLSFNSSDVVFDVSFEAIDGGFQVNDGKSAFKIDDESYGYVQNWFIPKSKVVGFMALNGTSLDVVGAGSFAYAAQSKPQSVGRWNFVNFQSKSDALLLYQVNTG